MELHSLSSDSTYNTQENPVSKFLAAMSSNNTLVGRRLEYVYKQIMSHLPTYPPDSVVSLLRKVRNSDPTPKLEFAPWIYHQYRHNLVHTVASFSDDSSKMIHDTLSSFLTIRPKLRGFDINKYTLSELVNFIEEWHLSQTVSSDQLNFDFYYDDKKSGITIVYSGPDGTLSVPHDAVAARILGAGTKWCTTQESYFNSYNNSSPLYIWKPVGGKKMQIWLGMHRQTGKDNRVHIGVHPTSPIPVPHVKIADDGDRYLNADEIVAAAEQYPTLKAFLNIVVIDIIDDILDKNSSNTYWGSGAISDTYTLYHQLKGNTVSTLDAFDNIDFVRHPHLLAAASVDQLLAYAYKRDVSQPNEAVEFTRAIDYTLNALDVLVRNKTERVTYHHAYAAILNRLEAEKFYPLLRPTIDRVVDYFRSDAAWDAMTTSTWSIHVFKVLSRCYSSRISNSDLTDIWKQYFIYLAKADYHVLNFSFMQDMKELPMAFYSEACVEGLLSWFEEWVKTVEPVYQILSLAAFCNLVNNWDPTGQLHSHVLPDGHPLKTMSFERLAMAKQVKAIVSRRLMTATINADIWNDADLYKRYRTNIRSIHQLLVTNDIDADELHEVINAAHERHIPSNQRITSPNVNWTDIAMSSLFSSDSMLSITRSSGMSGAMFGHRRIMDSYMAMHRRGYDDFATEYMTFPEEVEREVPPPPAEDIRAQIPVLSGIRKFRSNSSQPAYRAINNRRSDPRRTY